MPFCLPLFVALSGVKVWPSNSAVCHRFECLFGITGLYHISKSPMEGFLRHFSIKQSSTA